MPFRERDTLVSASGGWPPYGLALRDRPVLEPAVATRGADPALAAGARERQDQEIMRRLAISRCRSGVGSWLIP
jgi:hypothetical protein